MVINHSKSFTDSGVLTVKFDRMSAGDSQWLMLSSDRHFDSVKCDRTLMKKQLDLAKERGAMIIDVGDFFDAMQGRYDPRRSYEELRPEYKTATYLDDIVTDASSFYSPYSDNILMIARGNHDQTVLKNNGTDIISNLVYKLNSENRSTIAVGNYGGWIKFQFKIRTTRTSINLRYFHGSGGDAPATKGTIQTARQAVYLPDAHIVVNGHSHNNYILPLARDRVNDRGKQYKDLCWYVRTPSYSDSYGKGLEGWEVERGGHPKPLGCVWVKLAVEGKGISTEIYSDLKIS